jgi:predicted amidohydrolase
MSDTMPEADVILGSLWLRTVVGWARRAISWPRPFDEPVTWTRSRFPVAAVQWRARPVARVEDFVEQVGGAVREARRLGAALLVFPEDLALQLLGLLTERVGGARPADLEPAAVGRRLAAWAPLVEPLYLEIMRAWAVAAGMAVVAGSSVGRSPTGPLNNRTWFIDPRGRLQGPQPKLHPIALERAWGIEPGRALMARPEGWPVAAFVCNDATFFETYRMAEHLGAEVVAVPIADPDPHYTVAKARRGAWARSQETGLASVVAALTGELFGLSLTGKAGVYVPAGLTPDGSGVLAESPEPVGAGLVLATLDLDALERYRRSALVAPRAVTRRWLFPRYARLADPTLAAPAEQTAAPTAPQPTPMEA